MFVKLTRRRLAIFAAIVFMTIVATIASVIWNTTAGVVAVIAVLLLLLGALVAFQEGILSEQRQIRDTVDQQAESTRRRIAADLQELAGIVQRETAELSERLATLQSGQRDHATSLEHGRQLLQDLTLATRQGFVQMTVDAWSMHNLLRLIDVRGVFPAPGGWALTPNTLLELVTLVQNQSPNVTILECGSGTSTVWLAHCLRDMDGRGRVISLEHDSQYADITEANLKRLGLDDWADVRRAPLREIEVNGRLQKWYDTAAIEDLHDVGLLIVDGPPSSTGHEARYPAFPVLVNRLSRDALVLLDDVTRPDEQSIAEQWLNDTSHGLELATVRHTDRALLFRVTRSKHLRDDQEERS